MAISLATIRPPDMVEVIHWHKTSPDELPDADTTVLIIESGEVDASLGFLDGDVWRSLEAWPLAQAPLYWAYAPCGPNHVRQS